MLVRRIRLSTQHMPLLSSGVYFKHSEITHRTIWNADDDLYVKEPYTMFAFDALNFKCDRRIRLHGFTVGFDAVNEVKVELYKNFTGVESSDYDEPLISKKIAK